MAKQALLIEKPILSGRTQETEMILNMPLDQELKSVQGNTRKKDFHITVISTFCGFLIQLIRATTNV